MAETKTIQIVLSNETGQTDKLLLKICRNETEWLSPIGWKDYETSTLLPYIETGGAIQIFFTDEHTGDLKAEDTLLITSYELGLEQTIAWETAKRFTPTTEEKKSEKSGSFLSKLTGTPKTDVVTEVVQTDVERRVADAQRASDDYKAKMQAATAAQEAARKRAQEAARQAEEALRLEAERAAEMERAAKAFEEAERLQKEEMRRIEEERRLEEERRAEEARRIEAARQRQLAAQREAERQAALSRFTAALDVTQNENRDLKKRLSALRGKSDALATERQQKLAQITKLKETLEKSRESLETRTVAFEKKQATLDGLAEEQAKLHSEADNLKAERQNLSLELTQAETEYSLAQKVVEEAIARSEAKRIALEAKRRKDTEILDRISETSEKLGQQSRMVSETSVKAQDLKAKLETAQSRLSQSKLENETLERESISLQEAVQTVEYDMEIAQSSLEDLQRREIEYNETIAHLEAGGLPDEIDTILSSTDSLRTDYDAKALHELSDVESISIPKQITAKTLASAAPAKLSFPVPESTPKASFLSDVASGFKLNRNSRTGLMTLAVLIGGVAIIGGSYAAYNSTNSKALVVKKSEPNPQDVASAVTEIDKLELEGLTDTVPETTLEDMTSEDSLSTEIETEATAEPKIEEPDLKKKINNAQEEASLSPNARVEKKVDVTPEIAPTKSEPVKLALPKPEVKPALKPVVKKASLEIKAPKAIESVTQPEPNITSKKVEEPATANYPELTLDVQSKLSQIGFYSGPIDGVLSKDTKAAILEYKSFFDLPANSDISGPFLNKLSKSLADREAAVKLAALAPTPSPVQPLEHVVVVIDSPITPADAVPAMAAPASVETETSLPDIEPKTEAEPVKVAVAPISTPKPEAPAVSQDIIVEASLKNKLSSKYPRKAERRNHFVNATVHISYDIGIDGKPTNIQVAETDYSGPFAEDFEAEAIKTISKARYEPRTVNGVAAVETGNIKKIIFRGE